MYIYIYFKKYKDYKNILLFTQPVCFDMYLFNKNPNCSPSW